MQAEDSTVIQVLFLGPDHILRALHRQAPREEHLGLLDEGKPRLRRRDGKLPFPGSISRTAGDIARPCPRATHS